MVNVGKYTTHWAKSCNFFRSSIARFLTPICFCHILWKLAKMFEFIRAKSLSDLDFRTIFSVAGHARYPKKQIWMDFPHRQVVEGLGYVDPGSLGIFLDHGIPISAVGCLWHSSPWSRVGLLLVFQQGIFTGNSSDNTPPTSTSTWPLIDHLSSLYMNIYICHDQKSLV